VVAAIITSGARLPPCLPAYRAGAEHAVQVRIDEALAGADRIDIAHAQHQVDRQRGRLMRQGVEQIGQHFDRPRLVAMHAHRDSTAGRGPRRHRRRAQRAALM
jgi:glutamate 5-kinase